MSKLVARRIQREALSMKRMRFRFELAGTCAEGPSFCLVSMGQLLVDDYAHVPAGGLDKLIL